MLHTRCYAPAMAISIAFFSDDPEIKGQTVGKSVQFRVHVDAVIPIVGDVVCLGEYGNGQVTRRQVIYTQGEEIGQTPNISYLIYVKNV